MFTTNSRIGSTVTGSTVAIVAAAFMLLFVAGTALTQEHPEHPTEHPTKAEEAKVDMSMVAVAIADYVKTDTKLKGGFFLVYDADAKKALLLTLTKVHEERLAKIGDNLYFACSDFREDGGKMYDLDFFMEGDHHELKVTEVMIHKEEGKARYSWFEEDGIWSRK